MLWVVVARHNFKWVKFVSVNVAVYWRHFYIYLWHSINFNDLLTKIKKTFKKLLQFIKQEDTAIKSPLEIKF